jgi:GNAT superfamily N-acetyltransferase
MAIRLAHPTDLAEVQACVAAAFDAHLTRLPLPPAALSADYGDLIDRGAVYIAVDPSVVGTVTVTGKASDLVISNLAVHPSRQGSGVGRAMMRFAEDLAAEGGYECVTLFTHELRVENIRHARRSLNQHPQQIVRHASSHRRSDRRRTAASRRRTPATWMPVPVTRRR